MKKEKGQSLVEFALVIPFFLFLVFAIIYAGMLFHDYSTLTGIARSAAREAAIITEVPSTGHYVGVETFYLTQSQNTLTTLYRTQSVDVEHKTKNSEAYVTVRIHMVRTIISYVLDVVTPRTFDIVYFMKKDTPTASSPSGD
jgi:Flp pilus assembly protein TadG